MGKLHTYDVRLENASGGRVTVRVRATEAQGARQLAAERFPDWTVLSVKRSTYAR